MKQTNKQTDIMKQTESILREQPYFTQKSIVWIREMYTFTTKRMNYDLITLTNYGLETYGLVLMPRRTKQFVTA